MLSTYLRGQVPPRRLGRAAVRRPAPGMSADRDVRRRPCSVVIARLNDDQVFAADGIDEPMLVGDPPRPIAAEIPGQPLWLPDPLSIPSPPPTPLRRQRPEMSG